MSDDAIPEYLLLLLTDIARKCDVNNPKDVLYIEFVISKYELLNLPVPQFLKIK